MDLKVPYELASTLKPYFAMLGGKYDYRVLKRILFAAKHSWTALHMSRPLFVGSYLQVTWWALGQ